MKLSPVCLSPVSEFSDRILLAPLCGQKSENTLPVAVLSISGWPTELNGFLGSHVVRLPLSVYMSSRGEAEVWPFALWLACALRLDSQGVKPIAI